MSHPTKLRQDSPPTLLSSSDNPTAAFFLKLLTFLVFAGIMLIPLIIDPHGKDPVRLPKLYAFRAAGLSTAFALLGLGLYSPRLVVSSFLRRPEAKLTIVFLLWSCVTVAASTNLLLSASTLVTLFAGASLFTGFLIVLSGPGRRLFDLWLVGPIANALLGISQRLGGWDIFQYPIFRYSGGHGLLGNPNDLGSFLTIPAVASTVIAISSSGKRRVVYTLASALFTAGIVASGTLTALLAFTAAILAMATLLSWKRALLAVVAIGVALSALFIGFVPIQERIERISQLMDSGQFNVVLTGRLSAAGAGFEMVRAHPITGVGPGTWEWQYLDHRMAAEKLYPKMTEWPPVLGGKVMFATAHNDHLQIAAETGVVGYFLFLTALGLIATVSLRSQGAPAETAEWHARFARRAGLPLAVAFAVLALAQFPLHLAASGAAILFMGAAIRSFSHA